MLERLRHHARDGLRQDVDLEEDAEEEDDREREVAGQGKVVVAQRAVGLADGHEHHVEQAEHEGEEELVHGVRYGDGGEADEHELLELVGIRA
eukprot:scaffold3884_cov68-Phaeocystis_antarctica.AAC.5